MIQEIKRRHEFLSCFVQLYQLHAFQFLPFLRTQNPSACHLNDKITRLSLATFYQQQTSAGRADIDFTLQKLL